MKNLFISLFIFIGIASSQESWVVQDSFPLANPLHSVYFVNKDTGWAVGANAVALKTTNAGTSWTRLPYAISWPTHPYQFRSVIFPTADTGYFALNHSIMQSIDGGITITDKGGSNDQRDTIRSIDCITKDKCIACGDNGKVYLNLGGGATQTNTSTDINSIKYQNDTTIIAVGNANGWFRKIGNAGFTIYHTANSCDYKALTLSKYRLFPLMAVGSYSNGNACYHTTFAGFGIQIPIPIRLKSVLISDSVTAWAFGDKGVIKFTKTPTGMSYTVIPTPTLTLYSGLFTSPTTGWAVGQNGMILKYIPGPVPILNITRKKHTLKLNFYDILGRNISSNKEYFKIRK